MKSTKHSRCSLELFDWNYEVEKISKLTLHQNTVFLTVFWVLTNSTTGRESNYIWTQISFVPFPWTVIKKRNKTNFKLCNQKKIMLLYIYTYTHIYVYIYIYLSILKPFFFFWTIMYTHKNNYQQSVHHAECAEKRNNNSCLELL